MGFGSGFTSSLQAQVKSPTEFQAVILVGFGSRLSAMTEDEVVPKCLLPIANKPLLYYQLQWLENASVSDIIVLCQPSARQRLNDYVYRVYEGSNDTKVELVVSDGDAGSADALRGIKDKIKSDVIVMSSDLMIDFPPHILIDGFRSLNGSMTALFYEMCKGETECRSSKDEDLSDVVGIDFNRARLLTLDSKVDIDEQLPLRLSLLKKFPVLNICTQYRDAHLYVFKKWVVEFLGAKKGIHSIRNDLVPILLKCQYDDEFAKKEGIQKYVNAQPNLLTDAYALSTTGLPDFMHPSSTWNTGECVRESTSSALAPSSEATSSDYNEQIVCHAMIVREKDGFCARANTVGTYLDVNLKIAKLTAASKPPNKAEIGPKSQIGNDCMIGDSTKIGERTSVKRSVIGAHCTIGKNAKISDSVIMDYAVVEDNCKIEGTVVCSGAKVHEKCSLKDCEVASGYTVDKETSAKGESFIDYGE